MHTNTILLKELYKMKHKHHEFIVAWAEGHKIEYRNTNKYSKIPDPWLYTQTPKWCIDTEYRIQPPNTIIKFKTCLKAHSNGEFEVVAVQFPYILERHDLLYVQWLSEEQTIEVETANY